MDPLDTFFEVLCETIKRKAEEARKPTILIALNTEETELDHKQRMETILNREQCTVKDQKSCPKRSAFFFRKNKETILVTFMIVLIVGSGVLVLLSSELQIPGAVGFSFGVFVLACIFSSRWDPWHISLPYTLKVMFMLCFMRVPTPTIFSQTKPSKKNKYVFIPLKADENSDSIRENIPKIFSESMELPEIENLAFLWKIAEDSDSDVYNYSFNRDSVKPFKNGRFPMWIVFAIVALCVIATTVTSLIIKNYRITICTGVVASALVCFHKIKSRKIDKKQLSVEEKLGAVDKICRIHQLVAKEKINFILISNRELDPELIDNICQADFHLKFFSVMHKGDNLANDFCFDLDILQPGGENRPGDANRDIKKCLAAGVEALEKVRSVEVRSVDIFILNGIQFVKDYCDKVDNVEWRYLNLARMHFQQFRSRYERIKKEVGHRLDEETTNSLNNLDRYLGETE